MPKLPAQNEKPFYEKGLKFNCQEGCSGCCGGAPGYVWLEDDEIKRIAEYLNISTEEFLDQYTHEVSKERSLKEVEEDNWNCIMLKNGLCTIYEVRPMQCRTYPFWHTNLISEQTWKTEKKECPGIDEGRLYSREEIEQIANEEATIDSVKSK